MRARARVCVCVCVCVFSFLEIYNETIHDLLSSGSSSSEHKITHHSNGETEVSGTKVVHVKCAQDVQPLIDAAR